MHPNLKYWLWLTSAFGAGIPAKWNFLACYDSVVSAYEAVAGGDFSHVMPKHKRGVESATLEAADKLIEYIAQKGISVCCYEDDEYPQRLRDIYNPPSVLFYKGDISIIDPSVVISCVGTRKPSDYSVKVCSRICQDLAKSGVIIASGFQLGMDTLAHISAIKAGGKTIAVLPCGIMYDYPKENAKAKTTIAENGLLISELFPGDKPGPLTFRARNRILSGIGLGTLVMQAGAKSGALSTASFALAQGRDIFCVSPHELYNDDYAGVVNLIRDGAIPVFDAGDILNEYFSNYSHKLNIAHLKITGKSDSGIFEETSDTSKKRSSKKQPKPNTEEKPAEASEATESDEASEPIKTVRPVIDPSSLSPDRQIVYAYLSDNGVTHIDDIANALSSQLDDPEELVTDMEIEGILQQLPGNRFSI